MSPSTDRRFPTLALGILLAGVMGAGFLTLYLQQREILSQLQGLRSQTAARSGLPSTAATLPPSTTSPKEVNAMVNLDDAAVRGNAGAKVTFVEFSDFECPFCGRYYREVLPQILRDYVDTGKVRYVFRNFPLPASLHPHAFNAAEAGECARTMGKFWQIHDLLFTHQNGLTPNDLPNYAEQVGLDGKAFRACLTGGVAAKIQADVAVGTALGVLGTPTFFFGASTEDGRVHVTKQLAGALPYAVFQGVLEDMLKTAR
jgi:protein-disulfide isomerase